MLGPEWDGKSFEQKTKYNMTYLLIELNVTNNSACTKFLWRAKETNMSSQTTFLVGGWGDAGHMALLLMASSSLV